MGDGLGTIPSLGVAVVLLAVGVTWRMGLVESRLAGIEQSVDRQNADVIRLCVDVNRRRDDVRHLWDGVEAILLRLPAKVE